MPMNGMKTDRQKLDIDLSVVYRWHTGVACVHVFQSSTSWINVTSWQHFVVEG